MTNWLLKISKYMKLTPEIDGIINQIIKEIETSWEQDQQTRYSQPLFEQQEMQPWHFQASYSYTDPYTQQPEQVDISTSSRPGSDGVARRISDNLSQIEVSPKSFTTGMFGTPDFDTRKLEATLNHEFTHIIDPKVRKVYQYRKDKNPNPPQWTNIYQGQQDPQSYFRSPAEVDAFTTEIANNLQRWLGKRIEVNEIEEWLRQPVQFHKEEEEEEDNRYSIYGEEEKAEDTEGQENPSWTSDSETQEPEVLNTVPWSWQRVDTNVSRLWSYIAGDPNLAKQFKQRIYEAVQLWKSNQFNQQGMV